MERKKSETDNSSLSEESFDEWIERELEEIEQIGREIDENN